MTGDRQGMPTGAVVSLPDSPPISDDEDVREVKHGCQTENMESKQPREAMNRRPKQRVSPSLLATEASVSTTPSAESTLTSRDEKNDLGNMQRPKMVRKKSGELVRPALRRGSCQRSSSMPGTPTSPKAVHFDSDLEHVRHFSQVERPLAWETNMIKFPIETPARKALPVRLERVWLSTSQKFLHGSVAVLNLAFSKSVVCRFTFDYWKTASEIAAEYSAEILPRTAPEGHDQFIFTINLSDVAFLEARALYFCIRYNVDGKEFWDNNGGTNFQVDFRKKKLPINGKSGLHNSNSPSQSPRRHNSSTVSRRLPLPTQDDFNDNSGVMFNRPIHDYLDEPPALRFKSSQSDINLPRHNPTNRLSSPSGQAFAKRYDFGASLSAAVRASKDIGRNNKCEGLYMKSGQEVSLVPVSSATVSAATSLANPKSPFTTINAM
ncbi:hypothetical protein SBRCBS47491_001842 [Sporothrix bragantina]|uniref:CBM21 domain-containing protein n=1 Tax=Sporothrix bragantina TaxID=671064 RepID=A0ABP0B252_9PEZI